MFLVLEWMVLHLMGMVFIGRWTYPLLSLNRPMIPWCLVSWGSDVFPPNLYSKAHDLEEWGKFFSPCFWCFLISLGRMLNESWVWDETSYWAIVAPNDVTRPLGELGLWWIRPAILCPLQKWYLYIFLYALKINEQDKK
jgi:hypothetical protein